MPDLARGDSSAPRTVDALLQRATTWSPREAVLFLLRFDEQFAAETGRRPTRVERLILTSLLRRRATTEP